MAVTPIERDEILKGLTHAEREEVLRGIAALTLSRYEALQGSISGSNEIAEVLAGASLSERAEVLDTKQMIEALEVLASADPPESVSRFDFLEDQIVDLEITSGDLVNEITIQYAYDFDDQSFKGAITKHNPLSKLIYGDAGQTLQLKMLQGGRQAEKIADAVLMTSSVPAIINAFKHNLRSLYVEVGDTVALTHSAGIGENGYQKALAIISQKQLRGVEIQYEAILKPSKALYASELLSLTQVVSPGKEGLTVTYENGVATITIYADVSGNPPVQGAEVTIGGVKKITDTKGQTRFNLIPGRYTAYITASGYKDAEYTFNL